ncbi:hypothetical protein PHYBOEH_002608 [Phytophthora boehmeriae]|uniref:EF-hand domain-containing protein n=1 Tax=Phytophthora boehmeriae TaxID=109152 RepID=A0A8T1WVG0_9STRA|nr:hypothetical protein PHYBOEH_002608 [Phytophthora boehmeriae]
MAIIDNNEVEPESSSLQVTKGKSNSKTDTHEPSSPTKKKTKQNKTSSKTTKNQKNRTSRHENNDVESATDNNSKNAPRKVQVKQRSTVGLIDANGSTVAAGTANSGPENAAPEQSNPKGFASGGHYGTLIESKRVEQFCESLMLRKRHVARLRRAFKREEQLGTGEITTEEFLSMLKEEPRQLTNGLFEYVGLRRGITNLYFDDFVLCLATVASWTREELLQYAFKQFDVDKSGIMDGHELRAFCEGLKSDSGFYFSKNVDTARGKLVSQNWQPQHSTGKPGTKLSNDDIDDNTLVDIESLAQGATEFQVAFYPLLQLQLHARSCALGDRFWSRVTVRRQQVERLVRYLRIHKGKLPPVPLTTRIIAQLVPFSQAHALIMVHEVAVAKFAEEERILQEQREAKQALALTEIPEENQSNMDS